MSSSRLLRIYISNVHNKQFYFCRGSSKTSVVCFSRMNSRGVLQKLTIAYAHRRLPILFKLINTKTFSLNIFAN